MQVCDRYPYNKGLCFLNLKNVIAFLKYIHSTKPNCLNFKHFVEHYKETRLVHFNTNTFFNTNFNTITVCISVKDIYIIRGYAF